MNTASSALAADVARQANERLARLLALQTTPTLHPAPTPDELAAWPAAAWGAIVAAAARQGLSPLLYQRWVRERSAPLPAALAAQLRGHYYATAAANLRHFHALGQALAALEGAGLRAVALKGAHLAPLVYGDLALRPMADLDLLVEDAAAAEAALRPLGYTSLPGEEWMAQRYGHHTLRDAAGGILELHESIAALSARSLDHCALWARTERVSLAGVPALVLAPEDLLLHICLHAGAQDLFLGGLRPFYDLAAILHHYGARLDQGLAAARAHEWGLARVTHLCLLLAHELLGAPVHAEPLAALAPNEGATAHETAARRAVHHAVNRLVLDEALRAQGAPSPNLVALWAGRQASPWEVARRVFWPEPSHLRALLGLPSEQPLRPWHYVRRWLHLATRRRRTLRLLAAGREEAVDWQSLVRWLAEG